MSEKQLVIFKLGLEEYAVSIFEVREIIKYAGATKIPETSAFVDGIINLRGKVVPIINLASKFGQEFVVTENSEQKIIIIAKDEQYIGIIVDEVSEVLRINEKDIEAPPDIVLANKYIIGIGKRDKRLLIILSLQDLFSSNEIEELKKIKQEIV
ncbi:MAG: chemotaxis protein CheW [Clostridia bacterium]|nr:chemotaxis protein CheW [Clostridia bacterium]MDD4048371.1 chemotaxis protein CheW [Clostridia bacterium]